MDYRQDAVATLHDFGGADPTAPVEDTTVVVPLGDRDVAELAPERVFETLGTLGVDRVLVPVRAPAGRVGEIRAWLSGFDLPLEVLWCNGPPVATLLESSGLDGTGGKGLDVWLALGLASEGAFVVVHDADVRTIEPRDIRKLAAPLAAGFDFSKAYYARVENRQLFGRLYRLFLAPLLEALEWMETTDVVRYLGAFRYPLAGEMAMTGDLARRVRVPRRWGLEVGMLGEAFRTVGFEGSSQVDLGRYEHDHRAVTGPTGLSEMSHGVARALFRVLADTGYDVEFGPLRDRYQEQASSLITRYAADAQFNGYEYDRRAEREQVTHYAEAIEPPGPDDRLPSWNEASLSVPALESAARDALDGLE